MTLTHKKRPLNLVWALQLRDGHYHYEWHAPCGCAYHPEPQPHVHQCSAHKPTDTVESMQARIELLDKVVEAAKKISPELCRDNIAFPADQELLEALAALKGQA